MLSKCQLATQQLAAYQPYRCPLCHSSFSLSPVSSLLCEKGHHYDMAKKGYYNFHPQGGSAFYNRILFQARISLMEKGFFSPITTCIQQLLSVIQPNTLLDAGCGDGSHLAALAMIFQDIHFFGVDLSKEAIQLATNHFLPNILWSIGDIANLPFLPSSMDIIINILSPANYTSFQHCLRKGGKVVKVIPGKEYLLELRQLLGKNTTGEEETYHYIEKHLTVQEVFSLKDSFSLSKESYMDLISMTPLTASLPKKETAYLLSTPLPSITR
ncbi:MAG: methyltransferase domain-containing protein, partial [Clostridiales bacterium]|nr:methyltransferase domain-containing protein [Clostridiales bacterium]